MVEGEMLPVRNGSTTTMTGSQSDSESDYKLFRSELAVNHPAASAYLDELERCHWVKYAFNEKFQLPTSDEITSNLSEQANNWMGTEVHSAKPLDGFNCYSIKLSELMSEKRQLAGNCIKKSADEGLVTKLLKTRNDRTVAAGMCNFTPLMEGLTPCSNSARLQFLDMFIHTEL
ncbi:Hypothetical protein PHPALM_6855 [Phytophthora palmivora]|uniref:Uncharacterized protein n=1 Tax=Phytophthora palmivora TaxID=4796 RepID=A0A2P4YDT6_9STRA|nr:Hypothetical protein PHPALM_6855 [Phytophthora palmivora]